MIKVYERVVVIKVPAEYPDLEIGMEAVPYTNDDVSWWINFIDINNHDKDWSIEYIKKMPEYFRIIYKGEEGEE